MKQHIYFVYILSNIKRSVLYIGVTNDLTKRLHEHHTNTADSFTKRYKLHDLVYYEVTDYIHSALAREKEIKGWRREKKNNLIEGT